MKQKADARAGMTPPGLVNTGNTDYMNSVLECLANMQPLTEFLESDDFSSILLLNEANKDGSGGKVARAF